MKHLAHRGIVIILSLFLTGAAGSADSTTTDTWSSFCQQPRADTALLRLTPLAEEPIYRRFSNEGGILRWWQSDSASIEQLLLADSREALLVPWRQRQRIGQTLTVLPLPIELEHSVTSGKAASSDFLLSWFDPMSKRHQFAVQQGQQVPRLLWQSAEPVALKADSELPAASSLHLYRHQGRAVPVTVQHLSQPSGDRLQIFDGLSGVMLTSFHLQTRVQQGAPLTALALGELLAAPALLDRSLDGQFDRLYLVNKIGHLVRVDFNPEGVLLKAQQVADLSKSGWQFRSNMVVQRALLPANNKMNVSTASSPVAVASQPVASQHSGDVLILLAQQDQTHYVLTLMLPDELTEPPLHWSQLQLAASTPEGLRSSMNQAWGWYQALPAAPVATPSILAGVLYQPIGSAEGDCQFQQQANALLAVHLYQGSAIYHEAILPLASPVSAWFEIVQMANHTLSLIAVQEQRLVLPKLRGITTDCLHCSEVLSSQQFPRWQRLSSFQHEDGAY